MLKSIRLLTDRLLSTIRYFELYPVRVKPFLPADAFTTPSEVFKGPSGTIYSRIRSALARIGLLKLARIVIGLRLVMTARHYFSYSLETPSTAHFMNVVTPYPLKMMRAAQPVAQQINGVNVVGYLHSVKGLGQSAHNLIACLVSIGASISAWSIDDRKGRVHRAGIAPEEFAPPYSISIFHINADQSRVAEDLLGKQFYKGHYNVAYWYWELQLFPARWQSAFELYNEIWVASSFVQEAIQVRTTKPVRRIPIPVEIESASLDDLEVLRLPENSFIILFVFDASSIVERKNPFAIIQAVERAFTPQELQSNVKLVLKVNNIEQFPSLGARIQSAISSVNGNLYTKPLTRHGLNALFTRCDAYISLHRSEGFGLTLAEAMYLGRPVIGTGYSGNLDFMTETNSYLIPYKLIDAPARNGFYDAEGRWADPDIGAAAHALRDIYKHREVAAEKGKCAARDIRNHYSIEAVGRILSKELQKIQAGLNSASRF